MTYSSLFPQRKLYKEVDKVPKELESVLDQATFDKAKNYQLDKSNFGFWSDVYSQIEMTVSGEKNKNT